MLPKVPLLNNASHPKRVHAVVSTLVPLPLAVFFTVALVINAEDVLAERPAIHVTVSSLLMAFIASISSVVLAVMVLSAIFIASIWWTLYTKMGHVSKKTKEMQLMLTITLIVCATIPSIFGIIPLFLAIYAVVLRVEGTTTMFRLLFLAFIIQSVLNILAAMLLVKPYREVLLSWLRIKKSPQTVAVTISGKNTR
uniref:G_PROTEIN_RECEP_F1_2 domain-containing protein n=1 Tax=Steinernema glaseri TaxID=37863 RepID=A0A1I7YF72_9BILA